MGASRRSGHGRPFPAEVADCELCEAARWTHWYSESVDGWVADCEVCQVPMVVWWHHGVDPPAEVKNRLLAQLTRAGDERFGTGQWTLDPIMNQIPNHFHAHARDEGWWDKRFTRPMSLFAGVGGPRRTRP